MPEINCAKDTKWNFSVLANIIATLSFLQKNLMNSKMGFFKNRIYLSEYLF